MKKYIVSIAALVLTSQLVMAQHENGITTLPEMINTNIAGAPVLGQPILITGTEKPITGLGFGIAAPAFYDWDGDGIRDLLIGEFGSGVESNNYIGNFVRVYKNTGTEASPEFSGKSTYATPPFEYKALANGTPYSVDQFCCLGFTPQFVDLDGDGKEDMITGTYQGEVVWFKATDKGFLPGKLLQQDSDPRGGNWEKNQMYWLFSSASFDDLTGDGLPDLVTGGSSLRISKNTGTTSAPAFAKRELLLTIDGKPLEVYQYNEAELKVYKQYEEAFGSSDKPVAGDAHISPYVVDWDNDGVLDLLVTNTYAHEKLSFIDFFKGVKVNGEHRFQKPVALFSGKDGKKAFPGSGPKIFVTDYNNDGINDLLIGTSIETMHGKISERLAWAWEEDDKLHGAGKAPGFMQLDSATLARHKKYLVEGKHLPDDISVEDFLTIRHVGYVYVMLGEKAQPAPVKSPAKNKTKKGKKG